MVSLRFLHSEHSYFVQRYSNLFGINRLRRAARFSVWFLLNGDYFEEGVKYLQFSSYMPHFRTTRRFARGSVRLSAIRETHSLTHSRGGTSPVGSRRAPREAMERMLGSVAARQSKEISAKFKTEPIARQRDS